MDFDKYIQERWEGVLDIIEEKALKDYALGRAMIKFSQSNNPIAKNMRDRGMKQAKKYQYKRDAKLIDGLELIGEEIAAIISRHVGDNIIKGEVTPSKSGTAVIIKADLNSCDVNGLEDKLKDYMQRCIDKRQMMSYDCEVSDTKIYVKIKLFK